MKKLICVKDVDLIEQQGQKIIYIDERTIITPAARDAAKIYGIDFSSKQESYKASAPITNNQQIDSEMIYKALNIMMDKGLLNGFMDQLSAPPYVAEKDNGGLKVVRGNTVRFDKFHTTNPNETVFHQELMCTDESSMRAGFLTIEKSSLERELSYDEINYIIEGNLTITINGKTFNAYPGDVVFVPSNSKVVWNSSDQAKLFYTASN